MNTLLKWAVAGIFISIGIFWWHQNEIEETMQAFEINLVDPLIHAYYDFETDARKNEIVLTESEYKTSYLSQDDETITAIRSAIITQLYKSLMPLKGKSSKVVFNDYRGNNLATFVSGELVNATELAEYMIDINEEYSEYLTHQLASTANTELSLQALSEKIEVKQKESVDMIEIYPEHSEIKVFINSEDQVNLQVIQLIKYYFRHDDDSLTLNLYNLDREKIVSIKNSQVIDFDSQLLPVSFLEDTYYGIRKEQVANLHENDSKLVVEILETANS